MPTAYLWCPAYRLPDSQRLMQARQQAAALCALRGWTLHEAPSLGTLGAASTWPAANERLPECAAALDHDVLIAARGGYGCVHLLDAVCARTTPAGLLIGYSDLSVLHAAWRSRGWGETLYGFMPGTPCGPRSLATTSALAEGGRLHCHAGSDPTVQILHPGIAEGWCFAACLRVLAGLAGTPVMPDLSGAILAIEDLDERPYRLDRDLEQLHRAGHLRGIRGLVFGSFRALDPPGYAGPSASDIARGWAQRLAVPAVFGLPFGHESDPLTLAIGRPTRLHVDSAWTLEQFRR